MKKGIYYHGTSADCLESIMKEGLKAIPCVDRIWSDSMTVHVYLWDASKTETDARQMATESAQFSLVFARDPRIIVVTVEMPCDDVFPDTSGYGMEDMGAVFTYDVPLKYITKIEVSENLACVVPYCIKIYKEMPSAKVHRLTKLQIAAANGIEVEGFFLFDHHIDFTTYYIKPKKTNRDLSKNSSRQPM
jgi:hypothetical protein